jgi:Tol biopolymer transport system component/DNA-binding winged helix-turn-helix (wHTH) protein
MMTKRMVNEINKLYRFVDFNFDCGKRTLRRGPEFFVLSPKQSELLMVLLENAPEFVSKEKIFDAVWADTFVEDGVLTQTVYKLRKLLGNGPDGQPLIENKTRLGYRITSDVEAIEPDGERTAVTATSPSLRSGGPGPATFVGLALIAFGVIAAGSYAAYRYLWTTSQITFSRLDRLVIKKLTDTGDVQFPAISPDGKFAAYARGPGTDDGRVFIKDLESGAETQLELTNVRRFGFLRFSADGNSLYVRDRASPQIPAAILKVGRSGGEAVRIAENTWSGAGFSADDRRAYFLRTIPDQNRQAVIERNLDNGAERDVYSVSAPESFQLLAAPAVSPNDRQLAVVVNRASDLFGRLSVIDLETGQTKDYTFENLRQMINVAWLPKGDSLLVSASEGKFYEIWKVQITSGKIARVTSAINNHLTLSISADGKLLTTQSGFYANLWQVRNGSEEKQLTFGNADRDGLNGIAQLPSGEIVFSSNKGDDGAMNLWSLDAASGESVQLTKGTGRRNEFPSISPDGSIYFASDRDSKNSIWRIGPKGDNPTQITFPDGGSDTFPQVSPDGSLIYFIRRTGKTSAVFSKSVGEGTERQLTPDGSFMPANVLSLSPDGKLLAFQDLTDQKRSGDGRQLHRIVVLKTDDPSAFKLFSIGGRTPYVFWTVDSSAFEFIAPLYASDEIRRQSLNGGDPEVLSSYPKMIVGFLSRSRSGETFLSRGQAQNDAILLTNFE